MLKMPIKLIYKLKFVVALLIWILHISAAYAPDAVKLSDVQVITLYNGKMTNGRRSSPVPQLQCVGGSAGCYAFIPQVVQCYNRGFDGSDYQWECKTDMDNAYRFAQISVSCEGYSHPDDPYILKGSCGLEYTIDLTEEGYARQQRKGQGIHGDGIQPRSKVGSPDGSTVFGNILFFVIVGFMIYALYKTCIRPIAQNSNQFSSTNDDFGGYPGSDQQAPPPPGFRTDYFPGAMPRTFPSGGPNQFSAAGAGPLPRTFPSDGCSQSTTAGAGNPASSFWTGAATGGILGYMLGRRNSPDGSETAHLNRPSAPERSAYDPTRRTSSGATSSFESTGTRSASGFGGTKRR